MSQSENAPKTAARLCFSRSSLVWLVAGALLLFCSCDSNSDSEQDENTLVTAGSGGSSGVGMTGGAGPSGGSVTTATGGSVTATTGGTETTATGGNVTTPTGGTELAGGAGGDVPFDGGSGNDGGGGIEGETDGGAGIIGTGGAGGTDTTTGGAGGTIDPGHCLADITDYGSRGPFSYTDTRSGSVNMYVPEVPAGCKVPMIHHANGTGGTCRSYAEMLHAFASHGFLALCYESTQTGAGTQGIEAFETALAEYPDLADLKFGSTGHSQGGMSAFNVQAYAEEKWGDQGVYAGLAQEPASGFGTNPREGWQTLYDRIRAPMFMFSGLGTDGLVSQGWVQDAFDAMNEATEVYFWAKSGATHIPVPNGETIEIGVPWFRWKLLGDQKACEAFKAIRNNSAWTVADEQNEQPCN